MHDLGQLKHALPLLFILSIKSFLVGDVDENEDVVVLASNRMSLGSNLDIFT